MYKDSIFKYCTTNFSGEKVRVTLWGKQIVIIVTSTVFESFKFQGNSIFYRFSYDYSSPCQSKVTYVCIYINEIGITSLKTTSATRLHKNLDTLYLETYWEVCNILYIK